ncbi:hypothetical protein B0H13DRAFT_1899186 [Mycena leptocephala]|nr:hypothetical protein B0H13DRAFT_1899186 [Mycena leptocephala]
MIHLEITAKQSTLNFVLPNLEAIAVVDRGMEGKQAVVHMTSLVLAVLLRNQDNLKLFGTLADKDQTSLAKAFEEFGAHSQIKSLSKTEDHHYYSHQMHLYMLKKESEEMSKNLISAGRICSEISRDVNELDSLQIDYDNMHSKMRVVQEDQDKCFADLEHLELEYAKLTKDLEKNQAETQRLENKHHVTSLVMGDQRHLAAHWRDTNKDQEVKLEIKETQLSEMEIQLSDKEQRIDELQKLLSEKQQQNVRVEKELREFDKTKAELVTSSLPLTRKKNEIYMNFWLTQSKYDCIQQEELANTLQIVQVKDTKIRTLEEQLSSQSREENSSLADQTAILELREKNSEVLAEKLQRLFPDFRFASKEIIAISHSQNETTTTSEVNIYYWKILLSCTNAFGDCNSDGLCCTSSIVTSSKFIGFSAAATRSSSSNCDGSVGMLEEEHRNLGAIHALGMREAQMQERHGTW